MDVLLKTKLINSLSPLTFDAGRNAFWKIFDEYYFGRLCVENTVKPLLRSGARVAALPRLSTVTYMMMILLE